MKKFFSLVLALVMALSLTTVAWGANDAGVTVNGTPYETENSLLSALTHEAAAGNKTFLLNAGDHVACVVSNTYVLDGTVIDGTDATATNIAGLNIASSEGIDNLTIQNVTFTGDLHISGGATTNITIKNCVFADGTQLYIGAQGYAYSHTNVKVMDCEFLGTTANGTSRVTIQCPVNATVAGNTFASSGYHAVVFGGTSEGTIAVTDNKITGTVNTAVRFGPVDAAAVLEIQDNIVEGTASNAIKIDTLPATTTVNNWNNDWNGGALLVNGAESTALADTDTYGNTNTYTGLYAGATSEGANIVAINSLNFFKAVDNEVDEDGKFEDYGNVAYYTVSGDQYFTGKYYVEVKTLAKADVVVSTDAAGKNVYMYLDEIADPFYYGDGVVTKNFGTACGQYNSKNAAYDKKATYYVAFETLYVGDKVSPTEWLMVNGEMVGVDVAFDDVVAHAPVYTRDENSEIVAIKCSKCGLSAVEAPNFLSMPKNADRVGTTLWYWPAATAGTSTDKVTSAETFDAGIAMYVGMSVMAAAGSAVVIGKKKD